LHTLSMDIPWERVAEMLSDLCLRMKESGYPEKYRENVILSALLAWEKMVEMDRTGTRPMHRENSWKTEERAKIVEQGGIQLQAILNKPPPEDTDTCPKEDCLPCKSGQTKQKSCQRAAVGGVG
jgi:hypothetical protein